MGDLWERYRSPPQYIAEALRIVPYLIASQVRRNSNLPMLGIQAHTMFVCFGGFAAAAAPGDVPRWLRAAIPMVAVLVGLVLRDAYRESGTRPGRRAAFDVVTVVICVALSQALLALLSVIADISPDWLLTLTPRRVLLSTLGLAILFCLRMAADYRLAGGIGEISADDLAREFHQFERSVRWRKRREVVAAVGGLVVAAGFFWRTTDLASQAGWAVSIVMALFLIWYLASKTSVQSMPRMMSFASSLALYRRELERQRKLLRSVAWWWLLPIVPAIIGQIIGQETANAQPLLTPMQFGGYLVICFLVGWLYAQSARNLQTRMDTLATVEKGMPAG